MKFIENAKKLLSTGTVREKSTNMLEDAIATILGDPIAFVKMMKSMIDSPVFIRDTLFWENFSLFLDGVYIESEDIRKLSARLAEQGGSSENAKRIIRIVDDLDSKLKVEFVINLTRSFMLGLIEKRDYFRILKIIQNTIEEDLIFLKANLSKGEIAENNLSEEFERNGIMYITEEGNYAYSELAFFLDKYALSYGDEKYKYNGTPDFVPRKFPEKQGIITAIPTEEIDDLWK